MRTYVANVVWPESAAQLGVYATMMRHVGYAVEVVPGSGLVVSRGAADEDAFLAHLEDELAPFDAPVVDDYGEAAT